MVDLSSLPDPTPEEFLHEYNFYRNLKPVLYHESEKGNYRNHTHLVEGDLIPVTDRADQQLAKRCADLYNKFLASATVDCRAGNSGNNETKNGCQNNLNNNNKAQKNTSDNNNANPPQQQEKQTLHIPLQEFLEFTSLYHNLIRTANPAPDSKKETDREASLAQREKALLTREASLAHREATARMLFSTPLLTQQITSIWAQGYEAGYQPGFEAGQRSGLEAAYREQFDAVVGLLRRVREVRGKSMLDATGNSEMGREVGVLERDVEGLVRRIWVKAGREGGLGADEMVGMVGEGGSDRRQDEKELREGLRLSLEKHTEETANWEKVKGEEMERGSCRGHSEGRDVEMDDMEADSGVWF